MNREKLGEFHKKNILNAADKLFREFGPVNTTMNMVAKLADYSTATVYSYFTGKDEIFFTLVLGGMKELKACFDAIVAAEGDFERKYYEICRGLSAYSKTSPLYFEAMTGHINMNIASADTPRVFAEIFETGNAINGTLSRLLKQGVEEGLIDGGLDTGKVIFYMWSSIMGVVRTTGQKRDYFMLNSVDGADLLEFSFARLLKSLSV